MRLAKKVFAFALAVSLALPSFSGMGAIAESGGKLKVTRSGEGSVIVRDDSGQHAVKDSGYEGNYSIGDSVTLKIKADDGNSIKAIEVNGKSLTGVSDGLKEADYKYKISKESQTIDVTFTSNSAKKESSKTETETSKAETNATEVESKKEVSKKASKNNSANKVIVGFEDLSNVQSIYLEEKGTEDELLKKLPEKVWVTLEDGTQEQIKAVWECTDDFENTEYDLYSYNLVLPEGYELGGGLTDFDLPYVDVYTGETNPNLRIAYPGNPNGSMTLDQKFGITKNIVDYLKSHEKDGYYIGTPYYDKVFAGDLTQWLLANGAAPNGKGHMNCTGFVADVFRKNGANISKVTSRRPGHYANASNWHDFANGAYKKADGTWDYNTAQQVKSYRFDCTVVNNKITDSAIQKALRSGKLNKGDILYFEPTNWSSATDKYGNTIDCHIGFFWGDKPNENKFWHSTHPSKGVEGSNTVSNIGNQISQIMPKSEPYILYVYPIQHFGSIELTKTSSNTSVTNGNEQYSREGAEYEVRNSANEVVGKIVTDKDGKGSLSGLPYGTYKVKETKAPKGYALDTKTHTVTVSASNASTGAELNVQDTPLGDPNVIIVKKQDAENGNSTASGHGTLEGAQFTVKYYSQMMTTDPANSGYKAHRTWILETDERGACALTDKYKVSGDDFYMFDGVPGLPIGTLTIQETKAPEGYLLNPTVYVVNAHQDNATVVSSPAVVPENVLKLTLTKVEDGTNKVLKGAVFEHTRPNGQKESFTTNSKGQIVLEGLERGTHIIKETKAPSGYALNKNELTFRVSDDNRVTLVSNGSETGTNGEIIFKNEADGNVSVTVKNKVAPFNLKVHKINDDKKVLEGAEFTLYSDKACKNQIAKSSTNGSGDLVFNDLTVGKAYYLKETKAPAGYRIPKNADGSDIVYEIKTESSPVDGKFVFYVNGKGYSGSTGDFCVEGTTEKTAKMTVVNQKGLRLPNTGSALMIPIVGAGAVLMGIALVVSRKKRS